jgi:signal transduction histidine kinase
LKVDCEAIAVLSNSPRPHMKHMLTENQRLRRGAGLRKFRSPASRSALKSPHRWTDENSLLSDCIQCVPDPLLITDLSARVVLFNTAAQVYFSAFTSDSLIGKWVPDLLRGCMRSDFTGPAFLQDDLQPDRQPLICDAVDPAFRHIQLHCSSLIRHTFPHHAGWVFRIADRSHTQDCDQLKDEDIRFLVHDLRAPLSNIISLVELERAQQTSSAPFLAALEAQAERGLSLSKHFLQASKAVAMHSHATATNLSSLLAESMAASQARAVRKKIRLQLDGTPPTPPMAQVDADLIRRAFDNVLDNAIKYSPSSSVVRCSIVNLHGELQVEFSDQGIGLTGTQSKGLFQPFSRLHQTDLPATPGFGLGLAFVQRAVTASGGRVEVESNQDGGTVFRLIFPGAKQE